MSCNLSNTLSIKHWVGKHVYFYLCHTSKLEKNVSWIPISSCAFQIHKKRKYFKIICHCSGCERQKWVGGRRYKRCDETVTRSPQMKSMIKSKCFFAWKIVEQNGAKQKTDCILTKVWNSCTDNFTMTWQYIMASHRKHNKSAMLAFCKRGILKGEK